MPLDPAAVLLADRVCVVTGAARGIGAAVAEAFARFGADVAICDRDAEGLGHTARDVRDLGRPVLTGVFDVRHGDAVDAFCGDVAETFGRVDVLVNNAGGTFRADFLDVSAKGQQALVDENFTSVTHFLRGVVPLMGDGAGASIVNVTSIEAHRAAPTFAIYAAMKAAVTNLTASLAVELGPRGIRVNAVAPDAIPTPGDEALRDDVEGDSPADTDRIPFATPLAAEGRADDVAAAVVYLASDMARFVTGTVIHVDGGNDAARGWRLGPDNRWHP